VSCPGCGDEPAYPVRRRADWVLWMHPGMEDPTRRRVCLVPTAARHRTAWFTECHDCTAGHQLQSTALAIRTRWGFELRTAVVASCCPRCQGQSCLPGFVMPS